MDGGALPVSTAEVLAECFAQSKPECQEMARAQEQVQWRCGWSGTRAAHTTQDGQKYPCMEADRPTKPNMEK